MFHSGRIQTDYLKQLDSSEMPDWVRSIVNDLSTLVKEPRYGDITGNNYIMSGTKKILFKTDYKAGSFEILKEKAIETRDVLIDRLAQTASCNLLYPDETFKIKLNADTFYFYFQKMKYCIKGDLWGEIFERKKTHQMELFNDIGKTLVKLHKLNVYPIDIKPENTLLCTCDGQEVFVLADLDDSVLSDKPFDRKNIMVTSGYSSAILFNEDFKKLPTQMTLEYTDWHAFSQMLLQYYTGGEYDVAEFRPSEKSIINSIKKNVISRNTDIRTRLLVNAALLLADRDEVANYAQEARNLSNDQYSQYIARRLAPKNIAAVQAANARMYKFFSDKPFYEKFIKLLF
jgi:tRNA A-37 threonylcarbamoyl transferase component Bud32